ncbi:cbb3-type cytochrome oxidase assembly protein CcoS [Geomonas paludis]|uniref:Cbb3-type cytochrome oxidase assembly protein CcoS n=1 Tax=Geomonas paludis TaxID=2740185 RepID=A0A6V8MZA0_9BACT|nr:cbb3-type cytochrome oxidase assembly protein CcoS [Geomonas paludis]UPU37240.1 cbb3-type cytochrome oxidase assembly protein CcoS [Geomonas paludis]GFO65134.1 hypothetical protein GMPD_30530 [Geomonas paludis]
MNNSLFALIVLSFFLGCGCWLFFLWGVQKGEFTDMERPKHRMLDDDTPIPSPVEAAPDPPVPAADGHELTLSHRHPESPQEAVRTAPQR